MRFWGPNIEIDGSLARASLDNQPQRLIPNTPADAEAYEVRTQNVLRQIAGNPAGKILLDGFTGAAHKATIRPMTLAVANSIIARADAGEGANTFYGADSIIWYDPIFLTQANLSNIDPNHHFRPEDFLVHEAFHALRQVYGLHRTATMPDGWDNIEEFWAITVTNIYLSCAGRNRDLRGDHRSVFTALAQSLYDGPMVPPSEEGKTYFLRYESQLLDLRLFLFNAVYNPIAAIPFGWNPIRCCEQKWGGIGMRGIYAGPMKLTR